MTDVLGRDLCLGARHISVLRGCGMVLHGSRQWCWLMNDQYVVLIVLTQVLLSEVKALHTRDLQLKHTQTSETVKLMVSAGRMVSASF